MMNKKLKSALVALGILLALPATASQDLETNKAYVVGFLAALTLNQTSDVKSTEDQAQSEFFNRAFQTRLGREPIAYGKNQICLPHAGIDDDLLESVLIQLDEISKSSKANKAELVYQAVQRAYPCS